MTFSIRQLQYFLAVAESGSVSGAARELCVAQSAVTTAVQQVEHALGELVFERSHRGVALTPTGFALLPKARQVLQVLDDAATVAAVETEVRGLVRVGVTYTVMAYFLPNHIRKLSARFPNLEVSWREMERSTVEQAVVEGELDFGLVLTSNIDNPALRHQTFVHSRRRLWVAPTHPLALRDDVGLAEVAQQPYALLTVDEADLTTRSYFGGHEPRVFIATSSIEAIRSVVANGNAVTILSDTVYRQWSLEGRRILTKVLRDPVPDLRIGLAWAREADVTPAMATLRDYFDSLFVSAE